MCNLKKFKPIKSKYNFPIIKASRIIGDKGVYEFVNSAKILKKNLLENFI